MNRSIRYACVAVLTGIAALALQRPLRSETAVQYRFSFPEPQHHWMAVEATFTELAEGPLELRMSRSSPGRYSLHDFAKNVYDVDAIGADGRARIVGFDRSGAVGPDAGKGQHLQSLGHLFGRRTGRSLGP